MRLAFPDRGCILAHEEHLPLQADVSTMAAVLQVQHYGCAGILDCRKATVVPLKRDLKQNTSCASLHCVLSAIKPTTAACDVIAVPLLVITELNGLFTNLSPQLGKAAEAALVYIAGCIHSHAMLLKVQMCCVGSNAHHIEQVPSTSRVAIL